MHILYRRFSLRRREVRRLPNETVQERRTRAIKNAKMAYKLLENEAEYKNLLQAIEDRKKPDFEGICQRLGIVDEGEEKRVDKLWKLIKYEAGRQPTGVCW
jgi:NAD-dependent DNA ligase